MIHPLIHRLAVPAALILMLAAAGCATDNRPPADANTAPLPNQSLRPGLNSPDTTNPLSGTGGAAGIGPVSPGGGFGGTSGSLGGTGHR